MLHCTLQGYCVIVCVYPFIGMGVLLSSPDCLCENSRSQSSAANGVGSCDVVEHALAFVVHIKGCDSA